MTKPTINFSYPTTKYFNGVTNKKKYIIVHHTGSLSDMGNVSYLANRVANDPYNYNLRQNYVSCHDTITTNGTIYSHALYDRCTWHAWSSSWNWDVWINYYWIGIEIVGYGDHFTDAQRDSVRWLISSLMKNYNIPAENVLRHKDISPGRKIDVDDQFWNNEYSSWTDYQNSFKETLSVEDVKYKWLIIRLLTLVAQQKVTAQKLKDALYAAANSIRNIF